LTQRTSWKIFALVITICMLSVGIAPAKPSCLSECCAPANNHASYPVAKATSAGLLPGCCSDSETTPCPHMLESGIEIEPYALSAVPAEVDPAMVGFGVAARDTLLIRPRCHHVTASMRPPIRGPSVSLFLQNLSLLI
jgi:hypothetical protein